jgi:D-glycero-alpha-D-manno-heptose 1-phosphate guanylyltransferase
MIEAIILAGGEGTRLRPVVADVPKPMAEVAGRPFLWWLLTRLSRHKVERVILSVWYKAEVIQDYFGNVFNGMEIAYSLESEPLGTGGAIRLALEQAGQERVVVLNGDTYTDVNVGQLLARLESSGADLCIAVVHLADVARYGSVVMDEKKERIIGFDEKRGSSAGYINAGIYGVRRDIFVKHSVPQKFSFERDFLTKQIAVLQPIAFRSIQALIDIGVPEDYALAQTLIPTLATKEAGDLSGDSSRGA